MPVRNGFAAFQENFPGGDYTADEWEFIRAVAAYQKRFGRRYPTWREVLHVALCLGYRKVAAPVPIDAAPPTPAEADLIAAAKAAKSAVRTPNPEPKPAASRPDADPTPERESA
jgi:hypothetical protein